MNDQAPPKTPPPLSMNITHDKSGNVTFHFSQAINWLAMPNEDAERFARTVLEQAQLARMNRSKIMMPQ